MTTVIKDWLHVGMFLAILASQYATLRWMRTVMEWQRSQDRMILLQAQTFRDFVKAVNRRLVDKNEAPITNFSDSAMKATTRGTSPHNAVRNERTDR